MRVRVRYVDLRNAVDRLYSELGVTCLDIFESAKVVEPIAIVSGPTPGEDDEIVVEVMNAREVQEIESLARELFSKIAGMDLRDGDEIELDLPAVLPIRKVYVYNVSEYHPALIIRFFT